MTKKDDLNDASWCPECGPHVATERAKVERLWDLLRDLEWAGLPRISEIKFAKKACPECRRSEQDGHVEGCELLVALIATLPESRKVRR